MKPSKSFLLALCALALSASACDKDDDLAVQEDEAILT